MRWTVLLPVVLAVLTALAACTPQESPVEAVDATQVALEDTMVVPVLAVARLESEPENRLEVEFTYPQLNPSAAPELALMLDAVNADIAARIAAEVDSFLVWARESAVGYEDNSELVHSSLEGAFANPFVNDRLFSASQEVYTYMLGAAHPITTTLVYNYDLGTGAPIGLGDLFDGATAYLDSLSGWAGAALAAEAEERGFDADGLFSEGFAPAAENFARFTLGPDSLTLHFPPYVVAPYVAGPFTVSLAYSDLRPVLMDTGPAATLGGE